MVSENDGSGMKSALFRLSHFDPTSKDNYGHQVLDYLVLDALAGIGAINRCDSKDIVEYIESTYKISFDQAEIHASGERLARRKAIKVQQREKHESPLYQIEMEASELIESNVRQTKTLEDKVISQWRAELSKSYTDFPRVTENLDAVINNLNKFLIRIFRQHGVECAVLLYPEDEKAKSWLAEHSEKVFNGFSGSDIIDAVSQIEIVKFLKSEDPDRRTYVTSLFNSSFFWHLIQIDETCSKLLRDVVSGQILLLDNNILYSLIGLHGCSMMRSVNGMIAMAKEIGYKLAVSTKTIDEFHASLKWHLQEMKQKMPLTRELARIATNELGAHSVMTTYWEYYANNGLTIDEFVSEKSHIEDLLQAMQINITDDLRSSIEGSSELQDEISILGDMELSISNQNVIEHDAFHKVLVDRIRGENVYQFSRAKAWFLTHDSKLPEYDRRSRKGLGSLPFCLLSEQWVQINRPLLIRTINKDDYELSFQTVVTQPYLRAAISSLCLEKSYNEVLGRLSRYKDMSPELALNVIMDRHFISTMIKEDGEERKEMLLENKFIEVATKAISTEDELRKSKEQDASKINELSEQVALISDQMKAMKQEYDNSLSEQKGRTANAEQDSKELRETIKREKQEHRGEIKNMANSAKRLKLWLKVIVAVVAWMLLGVVVWNTNTWYGYNLIPATHNWVGVMIAVELFLGFIVVYIPFPKLWKVWLPLDVVLIVAILSMLK
jgi:hypothetical protein